MGIGCTPLSHLCRHEVSMFTTKVWGNCLCQSGNPPSFTWHIFIFTSPLKITVREMLSFVKRCFLEGHAEISCSLWLFGSRGRWGTLHCHSITITLPGWWCGKLLSSFPHLSKKRLSLRSQSILQFQEDSKIGKNLGDCYYGEDLGPARGSANLKFAQQGRGSGSTESSVAGSKLWVFPQPTAHLLSLTIHGVTGVIKSLESHHCLGGDRHHRL